MFGSEYDTNLVKTIELSGTYEDDPAKSMFMIYGREGGGTTTLAASIVEIIPPEKNVYVLLTEMPHNFSGIVGKHFPAEFQAGRFIVPVSAPDAENRVYAKPLSSKQDFTMWRNEIIKVNPDGSYSLKRDDCGAIIVDALDTLREIFYAFYLRKEPNKGTINYASADSDLINQFFLPFNFQGIPVVVILKHKQETDWKSDDWGKLLSVTKVKNPDGTPKIVPTIDGEKITRWSTIRLWCEDKPGTYEVTKTKGMVEEHTRFQFGFKEKSHSIRTGVWLKQLVEKMKAKPVPPATVKALEM